MGEIKPLRTQTKTKTNGGKTMKIYEVTKIVINRRGRIIAKESWTVAFNSVAEMNYYMNGKWTMAEDNESFTAIEILA